MKNNIIAYECRHGAPVSRIHKLHFSHTKTIVTVDYGNQCPPSFEHTIWKSNEL